MKRLIIIIGIFFSVTSFAQIRTFVHGGKDISREELESSFASLYVGGCSPAIKVGPRVFLSAGHCNLPYIPDELFKVVKTYTYVDYNFLIGQEECKKLVEAYAEGDTIDTHMLNICYQGLDLKIIVLDKEMPGRSMSIRTSLLNKGENVLVMGKCSSSNYYMNYAFMKVEEIFKELLSLESFPASDDKKQYTCQGDSGGDYFVLNDNKEMELVAIHTLGTETGGDIELPGVDKTLKAPGYWQAGSWLGSEAALKALQLAIDEQHVEICGINTVCEKSVWPYEGQ